MTKDVFKLEDLKLPFEDLIIEDDELLIVKGGTNAFLFSRSGGDGCGCGCGCSSGNKGCGCSGGAGCGCGCTSGAGCGCTGA